ncbi:MAG: SCO family protein [Verrucomicrobiota bacterium]|nr:SCO family protein [Verrucomicrobiota bacterium]
MAEPSKQLPRTLWLGLGMLLIFLGLAWLLSLAEFASQKKQSPPVLGRVADFTLTNQDGRVTTLADLSNHVWVADIIFTRCAASCPIMSAQMKSLQAELPPASPVRLVTLTCDPDYDTAPILKKYGEHYDADFHRWIFLTGTAKALAALATGSLKLGVTPVPPKARTAPTDFFVHSTLFVVVDQQARLRGVFQTEGPGVSWAKVKPQILAAVKRLEGGG